MLRTQRATCAFSQPPNGIRRVAAVCQSLSCIVTCRDFSTPPTPPTRSVNPSRLPSGPTIGARRRPACPRPSRLRRAFQTSVRSAERDRSAVPMATETLKISDGSSDRDRRDRRDGSNSVWFRKLREERGLFRFEVFLGFGFHRFQPTRRESRRLAAPDLYYRLFEFD